MIVLVVLSGSSGRSGDDHQEKKRLLFLKCVCFVLSLSSVSAGES